jgi:hypothetical protein
MTKFFLIFTLQNLHVDLEGKYSEYIFTNYQTFVLIGQHVFVCRYLTEQIARRASELVRYGIGKGSASRDICYGAEIDT